jgi:hypothetical protein
MEHETRAVRELRAVERVRCLECGTTYGKPAGGGTVNENPGCPRCGYLGWIAAGIPVSGAAEPLRSAADLPQRRSAQSR